MMIHPDVEHNSTLLSTAISIVGAFCLVTIVVFLVSKLFHTFKSCCDCYSSNKKTSRDDPNENKYDFIRKKPMLRYELLNTSRERPMSLSLESIDSYRNAEFEIPGMMKYETIQPLDGSSTSGYSTSALSQAESLDSTSDNRVFVDEYIQPRDHPNFKAISHNVMRTSAFIRRAQSTDEGLDTLMPELYENKYRRTQGPGTLGKLKFSLQYEDKTKRKLIMSLKDLTDLTFVRGMEHVTNLYLSAVLLPERDYRFQSKMLSRKDFVKLDEQFTFHSRPHNRDFESRTVVATIMYVEKSGKELPYGESRFSLLSHEIYSIVPTDISIGVKSCIPQTEIGDAQICLSYFSDQNKLTVMVKGLKFCSNILDNLTGVHIKAYLSRIGGERLGKKKSVSKTLASSKNSNSVDFQEHMTFELEAENFLLCTLKLNIHGRHKIMRKHVSLGKVRIGDNNLDCAGKTHWKTVLNSEGIGWTMWHVIYHA